MVGVLGQEFRLLPDRTVYENIAIACQITGVWERGIIRERIVPLLEQMGIRGKESLFPDDLSAGGRALRLCGTGETLREVLELTGLADRFEFYEDVNIAVRSFL